MDRKTRSMNGRRGSARLEDSTSSKLHPDGIHDLGRTLPHRPLWPTAAPPDRPVDWPEWIAKVPAPSWRKPGSPISGALPRNTRSEPQDQNSGSSLNRWTIRQARRFAHLRQLGHRNGVRFIALGIFILVSTDPCAAMTAAPCSLGRDHFEPVLLTLRFVGDRLRFLDRRFAEYPWSSPCRGHNPAAQTLPPAPDMRRAVPRERPGYV